jgi:hypothetical protein
MRGNKDDGALRQLLADRDREFHTAHAGHEDITQQGVRRRSFRGGERLFRTGKVLGAESVTVQDRGGGAGDHRFVIHDKDKATLKVVQKDAPLVFAFFLNAGGIAE